MRYSVNFTIPFGIDVSQKEIDKERQWLEANAKLNNNLGDEYLYHLKININSTDKEIATFLGVQNFGDAEGMSLDDVEVCDYEYSPEEEKQHEDEDERKLQEFIKINTPNWNKRKWNNFELAELDEILACMQDSDRYISEGTKNRLISEIEKRKEKLNVK